MTKKKYKIVYKRGDCIGAASCVGALPEYWSLNEDGKADIKDFTTPDGNKTQELIIEAELEDLEKHRHAAEVCPVNIIHIYDLETGEQIF
ncbi:MAG: ferredoxin [Candidatus Nanoarchaeia archaeon]|nr:ferredoxin [Candidatus Nanoarchaeia archaeon]